MEIPRIAMVNDKFEHFYNKNWDTGKQCFYTKVSTVNLLYLVNVFLFMLRYLISEAQNFMRSSYLLIQLLAASWYIVVQLNYDNVYQPAQKKTMI